MQYYYDIDLHFEDQYINYYEWDSKEHFNRLPIYKVESTRVFLENEIELIIEYKNAIVSDGIVSLGLEIIDNKVIYVSSLPYEDEFKINKLAMSMNNKLDYKIIKKKELKLKTNIDKIKNIYLDLIEKGDKDFIKFLYYEITGDISSNILNMKKFLSNDVKINFSDKYYQLYDMIIIGD